MSSVPFKPHSGLRDPAQLGPRAYRLDRYDTLVTRPTGDLIAVGRQMGSSRPITTAMYAASSDEISDRTAAADVR
jgi:hypothetical protein